MQEQMPQKPERTAIGIQVENCRFQIENSPNFLSCLIELSLKLLQKRNLFEWRQLVFTHSHHLSIYKKNINIRNQWTTNYTPHIHKHTHTLHTNTTVKTQTTNDVHNSALVLLLVSSKNENGCRSTYLENKRTVSNWSGPRTENRNQRLKNCRNKWRWKFFRLCLRSSIRHPPKYTFNMFVDKRKFAWISLASFESSICFSIIVGVAKFESIHFRLPFLVCMDNFVECQSNS